MKELNIDLLPLISKLEAVLKKGFSREIMAGTYQSVFKGKGMEFVGFREYSPADDALMIDWKASLKAHKLMVKELQEERDLTVFFMVDVSDSMLFSSHNKLKCEYTAELVATMCYAMHSVGDNVGMAMFNDSVIKVIPPGMGRHHFYKIAKTLADPKLYGGSFNLNYALNYLLHLNFLKKDAIIFMVSDFIGVKPGWETALKLVGIKYDFTTLIVRDPVDMHLPVIAGEVNLKDPYTGKQMLVNPVEAKNTYDREAQNQINKIKIELLKTNSSLLMLETDNEFTQEVFKFFRMRQHYKS